MHIPVIVRLVYIPLPAPGRRDAHHQPPQAVTHRFTPCRSHPKNDNLKRAADRRRWRPPGPGTRVMVAVAASAAACGSTWPLWMRWLARGRDWRPLQGTHRPDRGQEWRSDHENEAKRSRVRGPRAAAHLRRRPCRRPVGYGGGGARPPAQ